MVESETFAIVTACCEKTIPVDQYFQSDYADHGPFGLRDWAECERNTTHHELGGAKPEEMWICCGWVEVVKPLDSERGVTWIRCLVEDDQPWQECAFSPAELELAGVDLVSSVSPPEGAVRLLEVGGRWVPENPISKVEGLKLFGDSEGKVLVVASSLGRALELNKDHSLKDEISEWSRYSGSAEDLRIVTRGGERVLGDEDFGRKSFLLAWRRMGYSFAAVGDGLFFCDRCNLHPCDMEEFELDIDGVCPECSGKSVGKEWS